MVFSFSAPVPLSEPPETLFARPPIAIGLPLHPGKHVGEATRCSGFSIFFRELVSSSYPDPPLAPEFQSFLLQNFKEIQWMIESSKF